MARSVSFHLTTQLTLRDLPLIRDGSLRVLDLHAPRRHRDLSEFPRRSRSDLCLGTVASPVGKVDNPIGGGHFLADVIAGASRRAVHSSRQPN
jgi:hypothetical protein